MLQNLESINKCNFNIFMSDNVKKGALKQAWEEAMQRHEVYKKQKLAKIDNLKQDFQVEVEKKATGILGGIGLYYLGRIKNLLKSKKGRDKK